MTPQREAELRKLWHWVPPLLEALDAVKALREERDVRRDERDHMRHRAEGAEAEVERLRWKLDTDPDK